MTITTLPTHRPRRHVLDPARGAEDDAAAPSSAADHDSVVTRIVEEHSLAMLAYARRLCGDADTAQDLVQEALLRAWRHAGRLDERTGSIRSWLLTVLRNLDVDRRRALSSRPQERSVPEGLPGLENTVDPSGTTRLYAVEDRTVVTHLLSHLSPAERDVIAELYLRDRTVTEAARVLSLPAGTVKSRSFYAMKRLRTLAGLSPAC